MIEDNTPSGRFSFWLDRILHYLRRSEAFIGIGLVLLVLIGVVAGSLLANVWQQATMPRVSEADGGWSTPTLTVTDELSATDATPVFNFTPDVDFDTGLATVTPESSPPSAGTVITHQVKAGETLGGIALQYGVRLQDLLMANQLTSADVIREGQILNVPTETARPTVTPLPQGVRQHTVEAGEVLSLIAQQYGVTVDSLMRANDLSSSDYIRAGQVLLIPGDGDVPLEVATDIPPQVMSTSTPTPAVAREDETWLPSILTGDLRAAYSETAQRSRYTLYYPPDSLPARELNEILIMLDTAVVQIERLLDIQLSGTFDAYAAGSLFGGNNVALRGRSFSSQRRIFFLWDGTGDAADRQYIITHEATHTFTWNVFGQPASVMLHEGVAVFTGMPHYEAAGYINLDDFCAVFYQADKLPLPTGRMDFQGHIYDLTTYYSAGCFVRYLIETRGADKFAQLYTSGDYTAVYGESLRALEETWLAQLAARELPANLDADALVQYVGEVAQAYRQLFANFTGTPAEMRAYRALDRARTSTLAGRFSDARTHLADFAAER